MWKRRKAKEAEEAAARASRLKTYDGRYGDAAPAGEPAGSMPPAAGTESASAAEHAVAQARIDSGSGNGGAFGS